MSQAAEPINFDPHGSYLIVGGLGGIGSSLAVWMAENGARHLCLMSRSGASTEQARKALEELDAMECEVQLMICDVSDAKAVGQAISSVQVPLCGVIHAAMSLKVSCAPGL